jgi:hypothetical protein
MTQARRDACALCRADGLQVRGYRGVAFRPFGHPVTVEVEWVEDLMRRDGCWVEAETVDLDRLVVVMVGDDERHTIDADIASVLPREAFCGECGQVGCPHDGLAQEAA